MDRWWTRSPRGSTRSARPAGRPPGSRDLMGALVDMYWRAGDTLTTITMRAIYGRDDV